MMKQNKLKLLSLLLCCLLFSGCSSKSQAADDDQDKDLFVEYNELYYPKRIETLAMGDLAGYQYRGKSSYTRKSARRGRNLEGGSPNSRRQLLRAAHSAIGTPYVVGGTNPGGFDCSGLVCWAYGNVGVKLPRTAREQSVVGTRIKNVEEMQAGDIVAFRHPKRGYHTGIYVGGGKFIHSPRRKSHVKINSLDDPYFSSTFLGARRINLNGRENLLAQAESRLNEDYAFSSPRPHLHLNREDSRFSRNASRERSSQKRKSIAEYRSKRDRDRDRDSLRERRSSKDKHNRHGALLAERRNDHNDRHARSKDRVNRENRRDKTRSVADSSSRSHQKGMKGEKRDRRERGDNRSLKSERSSKKRSQQAAFESRRSEKRGKSETGKRHSSKSRKS